MTVPNDRKYTTTHEWVKVDGNVATIGITEYASNELGDITYVELPSGGTEVSKADSIGVIESVKAASDVYSPLTGEVVEENAAVVDAPELLNQSSFEDGWLIKVKLSDESELEGLMDAEAYDKFLEEGGGH